MADIEAKREARRKRILENSENRLNRITGVESRVTKTELDGRKFQALHEYDETTLPTFQNVNNVTGDNPLYESHHTEKNVETIFQNPRVSVDDDSVSQVIAVQQSGPRHFYILILPILMNLLLSICKIFRIDTESIYLNKIFMPLIGYEIYEYFFSSNVYISNSLISSALLLSNATYSRQVNTFLQYFLRIIQDLMIYFFVFFVCHYCMKMVF